MFNSLGLSFQLLWSFLMTLQPTCSASFWDEPLLSDFLRRKPGKDLLVLLFLPPFFRLLYGSNLVPVMHCNASM